MLREALETAAPLILAAYLDQVADEIPRALGTFVDDDSSEDGELTYDEGVDDFQRSLRARASELRGEGDRDAV